MFNILHYVVVLLVFTAIVSGIIIDSFAELRAAREATRLDILHTCFVCAIEREDFETLGLDFKVRLRARARVGVRVRVRVGLANLTLTLALPLTPRPQGARGGAAQHVGLPLLPALPRGQG